jgi:uncharacterized protein (TIGR01777 family)
MSITVSSVFDAPIDEVFAWHERPGALLRLAPPWQPVRVASEAGNLRDGRAVLRLPGGLRWTAQHQDYAPPNEFADELVGLPLRWRHRHEFRAEGANRTRLTDHVDTPVPAALLRGMFAYRHRQLADDLAVQHVMAQLRGAPLTVAVTGSSGLIGSALTALLTTGGHRVIRLVRRAAQGEDERQWDPNSPHTDLLDGVDAVVHLAGESIAGRFTSAHMRDVRQSRVEPTRRLAELAAAAAQRPAFICASAVGYYGPDRGDESLDETAARGTGFLADVVADWEDAAAPARQSGVRVVHVRTGIVQSPRGGALRLMRPLFAAALGGRLGDGKQWMAWIDLDDLCDIYLRALVDDTVDGVLNAVAPNPVRNSEYTRTLAHVLRRPAVLPVPPFGPRLLLGKEGAREVALAGQRVLPDRLTALGHSFRRPRLEDCLRHQLGRLPLSGELATDYGGASFGPQREASS